MADPRVLALIDRISTLVDLLDDGTQRTCDRCGLLYRRMHLTEHLQRACRNPPTF